MRRYRASSVERDPSLSEWKLEPLDKNRGTYKMTFSIFSISHLPQRQETKAERCGEVDREPVKFLGQVAALSAPKNGAGCSYGTPYPFRFLIPMFDVQALRPMFRRRQIRFLRLLAVPGQGGLFFSQAAEVLSKGGRHGNLRGKSD